MNTEQERADFEAWYTAQYTSYIPRSGNGYSNLDTGLAWQAYQAGRAALQSQKPKGNDIMLSGVIRMPFEMAMADPISRMQFYQRAQQALNELEALQSQDREDAIPAEIRLMAERIAADTFEHCTADPIFTVQKNRTVTGLDTNYTDNVGWFDTDSGDLVEGDEAAELESRYDDTGDEPEGYVRTGYFEEWEHYATFITMESAQEFAKSKGENCRVYVDSGCRNHEWKALREFLLSIDHARRIEGEGE